MTQAPTGAGAALVETAVEEPGDVLDPSEQLDPQELGDEDAMLQAITEYLETADARPEEQDIYVVLVSVTSYLLDDAGQEHSLANIGRVLHNLIQVVEDSDFPVMHDPDVRVSINHEHHW